MLKPDSNPIQQGTPPGSGIDPFAELSTVKPATVPSKILIVSIPRSGSTSLMKALGTSFDYATINEPFHPLNASQPFTLRERTVTKVIVAGPNPAFFDHFTSLEQYFSWLDKFRTNFDKTILLSRASVDDAAQSYASARERERDLSLKQPNIDVGQITRIWHEPYSNSSRAPDPTIRAEMLGFIETLATYSKRSAIPLVMYEDLYSEDFERFSETVATLNLPIDPSSLRELLDPSRRYRRP